MASKQNQLTIEDSGLTSQNLSFDWCKQLIMKLCFPRPDLVLCSTLGVGDAAQRTAFGGERQRYEQTDFQKEVAANHYQFKQDGWKVIDELKESMKCIRKLH